MANQSLVERILLSCERFERREIDHSHLFPSLEGNTNALEGLDDVSFAEIKAGFAALALVIENREGEQLYQETCEVLAMLKSTFMRVLQGEMLSAA